MDSVEKSAPGIDINGDVSHGFGKSRVRLHFFFDLFEGIENGGVIAAAEGAANLRR